MENNVFQLIVYIDNSRDIYAFTEYLQNNLAKKIRKGLAVSEEYLAQCSTMKRIIRMAVKMVRENEGFHPTKKECRQAAKSHAAYIMECAEYLASDN